ncbi:MAG: L-threonylcarbamoyladenylate synthase [Acidobacteriota bacterium]
MRARIIKLNLLEVEASTIAEIVRVLGNDGVIVYPTDTLYGIGANCYSKKAVRKIFMIKRRPEGRGMPVLISDLEMVQELSAEIPPLFHTLGARIWPGPLTLVLKAAAALPAELIGPERTIGIRLPDVPWIRELIRQSGVPLVATSANISGEKEISTAEEAIRLFKRKVDLIIDGGHIPDGLPSTVVDLTSEKPVIVREGAILKPSLLEYLG